MYLKHAPFAKPSPHFSGPWPARERLEGPPAAPGRPRRCRGAPPPRGWPSGDPTPPGALPAGHLAGHQRQLPVRQGAPRGGQLPAHLAPGRRARCESPSASAIRRRGPRWRPAPAGRPPAAPRAHRRAPRRDVRRSSIRGPWRMTATPSRWRRPAGRRRAGGSSRSRPARRASQSEATGQRSQRGIGFTQRVAPSSMSAWVQSPGRSGPSSAAASAASPRPRRGRLRPARRRRRAGPAPAPRSRRPPGPGCRRRWRPPPRRCTGRSPAAPPAPRARPAGHRGGPGPRGRRGGAPGPGRSSRGRSRPASTASSPAAASAPSVGKASRKRR